MAILMEYRARIIVLDYGYAVEDGIFTGGTDGTYYRAPFIFETPAVAAQYIEDHARGIRIQMANMEAELRNQPIDAPRIETGFGED